MAAVLSNIRPLARMLQVFALRDLREQYAGTLLGALWAILQPLLLVGVYWWVFGVVWALKVPSSAAQGAGGSFVVFLLSGLLPWLAFQEAINKSATAIVGRADVLRHGNFPVAVFPPAKVIASHVAYAGLLLIFLLLVAPLPPSSWLLALLGLVTLFLLQMAFACGLALLVSALTVYVRDLPHLIAMALMAVMFTAPILYPIEQVPERLQAWIWLNPYTPFATGFQSILLEGRIPQLPVWGGALLLASVALWAGRKVFNRLRPGFADVV